MISKKVVTALAWIGMVFVLGAQESEVRNPLEPEGLVLTYEMLTTVSGRQTKLNNVFTLKGTKYRTDSTPMSSLLVDNEKDEMVTLMHTQKKFLRISLGMQKMSLESLQEFQDAEQKKVPELKATGKIQTIDGMKATELRAEGPTGTSSHWLTVEFPEWEKIEKVRSAAMGGGMSGLMQNQLPASHTEAFEKTDGIVLRMETENMTPGGVAAKTVMTLKKAEFKNVPDSMFQIPEGYEEMVIPQFGQ